MKPLYLPEQKAARYPLAPCAQYWELPDVEITSHILLPPFDDPETWNLLRLPPLSADAPNIPYRKTVAKDTT